MSKESNIDPDVLDALQNNRMIEAVKILRDKKDLDLKDALVEIKEIAASIEIAELTEADGHKNIELRNRPDSIITKRKSSNGFFSVIIVAAIITFIIYSIIS